MHVYLCQPQEAARIREPPSFIKHSEEETHLSYLLALVTIAGGCRGRENSLSVVAIDRGRSFGKDHTLYSHPAWKEMSAQLLLCLFLLMMSEKIELICRYIIWSPSEWGQKGVQVCERRPEHNQQPVITSLSEANYVISHHLILSAHWVMVERRLVQR